MPKARKTISAAKALEQLVSRYAPPELADIHCDDGGQTWLAYIDAFTAAAPADYRKGLLTNEEYCDIADEIEKVLPGPLQKQLSRLIQHHSTDRMLHQEAVYAIGLELGRRLGGAR